MWCPKQRHDSSETSERLRRLRFPRRRGLLNLLEGACNTASIIMLRACRPCSISPFVALRTRPLPQQPGLLRVADAVIFTFFRHFPSRKSLKGLYHPGCIHLANLIPTYAWRFAWMGGNARFTLLVAGSTQKCFKCPLTATIKALDSLH